MGCASSSPKPEAARPISKRPETAATKAPPQRIPAHSSEGPNQGKLSSLPGKPAVSQPALGKAGYITKGQISAHEGATMKLMQAKKTKELVAAKWVPRTVGHGLPKNVEREIVNHRRLLHPNIIRFKEVFMTDECLVIVMEYASGGPLQDRIRTSGRLPEAEAKRFFSQLVDGLSYCHAQSVFHRGLCMDNLLLQGSYYDSILKISDFGYSKSGVLDSKAHTRAFGDGGGLVLYSSPELLLGTSAEEGYDGAAVDVWATGVILYYMLVGRMPFVDLAEPNVMNARVNQRIIRGSYELPGDVPLSRQCQDLLARIFDINAKRRIKAPQMKLHPWLAGTEAPDIMETVGPAEQSDREIIEVIQRAKVRKSNAESADLDTARGVGLAQNLHNGPNIRPAHHTTL